MLPTPPRTAIILFSWGMELAHQRTLDYMRFCFMDAGHTKFAPDRLFTKVSNSYNRHNVFTIGELKDICDLHAQTTIEDGVSTVALSSSRHIFWPIYLVHDYPIAHSHDQSVVMKVRENCCSGSFSTSPLKVLDPSAAGVPTITKKHSFVICLQGSLRTWSSCTTSLFHWSNVLTIFLLSFHQWCSTQQVARSSSSTTSSCPSAPPPAERPRKQKFMLNSWLWWDWS